ncbi:uncharacterized protein Z519_04211 [Cladophialophora bantiana CBS 173.52]|uniref:HNH nuclease domain-containing protein n=1 Tax=Cladophialophora bantiana (strain ATCC 10958 / CBS 173.52 / CDC B-1940 / NIH 8579) TaxID=1442370 RepID=A0A0D2F0A6_CLAB1|nr:uncharacterized protein Z519_04211 [Cladophialophora bantiana CBS 173.52]KIW95626.1 hypothetical protein Z519_04211 [Cladophialophora bantiana CBS 173.52]
MISLTATAHKYWSNGYFALKPVELSDDQKNLQVRFYWLSKIPYVPIANITTFPSLSLEDSDRGPGTARLFDHEDCKVIRSGDTFTLHTDDPDSQPLPDFKLLELQWFLQRLTTLSGAADAPDDDDDDDDDSEFGDEYGNIYESDTDVGGTGRREGGF